jgi:hypothetical protein
MTGSMRAGVILSTAGPVSRIRPNDRIPGGAITLIFQRIRAASTSVTSSRAAFSCLPRPNRVATPRWTASDDHTVHEDLSTREVLSETLSIGNLVPSKHHSGVTKMVIAHPMDGHPRNLSPLVTSQIDFGFQRNHAEPRTGSAEHLPLPKWKVTNSGSA